MKILKVYGENGREFKTSCLKYGIKKGMHLLLDNGSFHTCDGTEKIEIEKIYGCTTSAIIYKLNNI